MTSNTNGSLGARLNAALQPFLSPDGLAAAFLVTAILSGKLSAASLFPPDTVPVFLLEVRFWCLLASLVLARPLLHESRHLRNPALLAVASLLAFLVFRSVPLDGAGNSILDVAYMGLEVLIAATLATRPRCVSTMGLLALAAAVILFLLAAVGVKNEDLNGNGWAPIGGPITFYRIEFLGLCVALYFYLDRPRISLLVFIGVFFFATWASLSKIAIAASLIALIPVYAVTLSRSRIKEMVLLSLVLSIAYFSWNAQHGKIMKMRIAESAIVDQEISDTPFAVADGSTDVARGSVKRQPRRFSLNSGQDFSVRTEYCTLTLEGQPVCRANSLTDRSGRLLMFAEAMRGFAQSPLYGNGLGQYHVSSINTSTGIEQIYYYPHNIVAEMLYSGGLIALTLLAIVFGFAAVALIRAVDRDIRATAVACLALFMLLSSLATGDIYDLRLLLCVVVGLWAMGRQVKHAKA